MKLGRDTVSVTNYIYGIMTDKAPKVGTACTILMWTDRHPATITRVSPSGKTVWVKEDDHELIAGHRFNSEHQEYIYARNNGNPEKRFFKQKNGKYKGKSGTLLIGKREEYKDPSF